MTCGIYQLKFPSGRFYIGSSKNIEHRIVIHIRKLKNGTHGNNKLVCAFKKYGKFKQTIIIICNEENLLMYEQLCIDNLNPQCNCSSIAGRVDWNAETRDKLSKSRMGMKPDTATLIKLKTAQLGRKRSPEHIEKIRFSLIGRKVTWKTRILLSKKLEASWKLRRAQS